MNIARLTRTLGIQGHPARHPVLRPEKANPKAFGPAIDPTSLLGVAPTIAKCLLDNKLMEGKVDFAKGLDAWLVKEVAGIK